MQFRKVQWFVFSTMLIYIGISLSMAMLIPSPLLQLYIGQLVFIVLGGLFLVKHQKSAVTFARISHAPWWSFLLVIPVVLSTLVLSSFVTNVTVWLSRTVGLMDMPPPDLTLFTSNNLLLVISFALLPGIVEEFFCRGILLASYEESLSSGWAIFYSSLIFGFLHFNYWNLLSPMLLGLIFSMLTLRFQSVLPAMFGHAFFNLLVLGVQKLQLTDPSSFSDVVTGSDIMAMLPLAFTATTFLGIVFLRLRIWQYFKPARAKLRPIDQFPTLLIISLFLAMTIFIQRGMSL